MMFSGLNPSSCGPCSKGPATSQRKKLLLSSPAPVKEKMLLLDKERRRLSQMKLSFKQNDVSGHWPFIVNLYMKKYKDVFILFIAVNQGLVSQTETIINGSSFTTSGRWVPTIKQSTHPTRWGNWQRNRTKKPERLVLQSINPPICVLDFFIRVSDKG